MYTQQLSAVGYLIHFSPGKENQPLLDTLLRNARRLETSSVVIVKLEYYTQSHFFFKKNQLLCSIYYFLAQLPFGIPVDHLSHGYRK